ncbi:hypothetical protein [Rufibacter latericius]|uniref:Uncharacterized protein n=1 Tax=Rufibacter latericius TaxID=2487040 RepID=A0A3M9MAK3_9BACT|nr:hypothetical protein [Rufibacter latericius]RNI22599.1 hypothetical protein EFB08_21120 [Rufibacter latericius]
MRKPYNNPLRIKAYNRQFKNSEAEIFLIEHATDPGEGTNYTSLLYERYLREGAILEVKGGMYFFYRKLIHPGGMYFRALNFLQVLAYLEYYDTLRQNKINGAKAIIMKMNEEAKAKQIEKEQEKATKEESKGFSLEEREGVTFIKGTNFVLSKIM